MVAPAIPPSKAKPVGFSHWTFVWPAGGTSHGLRELYTQASENWGFLMKALECLASAGHQLCLASPSAST